MWSKIIKDKTKGKDEKEDSIVYQSIRKTGFFRAYWSGNVITEKQILEVNEEKDSQRIQL